MGKKRLEDAIQKIEQPVEVVYRSFELDPTVERNVPYNIYEKLASKYGMSLDQAKANCLNMVQMAQEAGLEFNLDTLILTNTFDAHRLASFAKSQGLMHKMTDRLLRAYYTESKHIGDHATLIDLAEEVGLNRDEVTKMLSSSEMSDVVRADEQEAQDLGIRSIPYFIINKKYAISGAQPTQAFVNSLEQIIEQDGPFTKGEEQNGAVCDENGCEIPEK
ncbi:DsbA family oxidoreductase [Alkalihalobacillus deserti]|uniref:DsbA family oxidoreductase n=1 Tax=Alkalihalobacillus deserti TaxID=2879466 RepID=UPI001D13EFDE|nr:DsbA family oxidoreductase [Alkalihalobacillus deserti]